MHKYITSIGLTITYMKKKLTIQSKQQKVTRSWTHPEYS